MKTTKTIVIGTIVTANGNGRRINGTLGKVIAEVTNELWAVDWDYLNKNPHNEEITMEQKNAVEFYKMA